MDTIIKNNDKFETIRVLMEILCKELGISVNSNWKEVGIAISNVTSAYYKAIEDFRELTKNNIRQ